MKEALTTGCESVANGGGTRRSFLRTAATAAAAAGAGVLTLATPGTGGARPHQGHQGGFGGGQGGGQGAGHIARSFSDIRRHENAHVAGLLQALGGNARPKPTFTGLSQRHLARFLAVSRSLENTGVGAYLGAVPSVSSPAILATAGSVALIEARHAGYLNTLLGGHITQNVFGEEQNFERALTQQEVVALAGPFVASLNGGPPLSFSTTERSAANDIAILNFALALEFLEAEFYNVNVPRFFRG